MVLTMVSTILPIKSRKIQESLELFRRADEVVSSLFFVRRVMDDGGGFFSKSGDVYGAKMLGEFGYPLVN